MSQCSSELVIHCPPSWTDALIATLIQASKIRNREPGTENAELIALTKIWTQINLFFGFGMWRSLEAHLHGAQGAAGSNPAIPTIQKRGVRVFPYPSFLVTIHHPNTSASTGTGFLNQRPMRLSLRLFAYSPHALRGDMTGTPRSHCPARREAGTR